MGTGNLPDLAASPTKVDATTTQYNAITDALQGHQVMRDSDGVAEDNVSDIGRPSSGRPRKVYVGTGINVAGKDIDFDSIALQTTGISSGKSKTSGYPNFLTAGGAGNDYFTIEGATTDLEITIDGQAYTLEADLQSDDLALAPSSNNTAYIDDPTLADEKCTKTIGEWGYYIKIDETGGVGSEIISLDGTTQCFSVNGEIFIGEVDTTNYKITPIVRGVGGTSRVTLADTDTLTLLKAHYIFLDNDLVTIDTTTTYPTRGPSAPVAPATGDYHYYTSSSATGWYRYSGASWEKLGRIYLGYAICDDTDCLYVEHEDYNLAWNDQYEIKSLSGLTTGAINMKGPFLISVAGELVVTTDTQTISGTSGGKWGYIYIDKYGTFYELMDIAPRKKGVRKGLYHPTEYYRCIGAFYRSGATFIDFQMSSDGNFDFDNIAASGLEFISGSGSAGNVLIADDMFCPIAETSTITVETSSTTSPTQVFMRDPKSQAITKTLLLCGNLTGGGTIVFSGESNVGVIKSGIVALQYNNLVNSSVRISKMKVNF